MQFAVLVFLPLLTLWQLNFGIRLIVMPASLLVCIIIFTIGHKLREAR